jgi:hypothetical protein
MRWAGHLAHMVEKRNAYKKLAGRQKEIDNPEYLDVYLRIILKWILER